ncbi:MAG TPA: PadR family transcriptional regulator [Gaiellaceae bacterium]|nr:PadR family transcriptional regulator [Gaiellaceae bacterium]
MASSLRETTKSSTTELAVLGLIAFGPSSGYDLSRTAARSIGHMWAPSRSQIYKVLPRLVAAGYARSREIEQQGRPDKAVYRITPAGRAALRRWIEEIEREPGIFLLKIFFGWNAAPAAALTQLDAYRTLLAERIAEFEQTEAGLPRDEPPHSRIALRHGIVRARATLAWADETEQTLRRARARRAS